MLKVSLGLALLCLLSSSSAEQLVPLLAWSNSASLSGVQSTSDISSILKDIKMNQIDVAVLLKSSSLSFDDIAKYGGVYGEKNAPLSNLQNFLSSSVSSLSAGFRGEPASELTSSLSFVMDTRPQFVTDIPQLCKSEIEAKQLFVVELPQGNDEDTFRTHDSIISKTVSTLDKQDVRYTIFYTADHASSPAYQHLNPDLVRRAASEEVSYDNVALSPSDNSNVLCYPIFDKTDSCISVNCTTCLLFCMTPRIEYKQVGDNETVMAVAMNTNISNAFTMIGGSCNTTDSETSNFTDFYDHPVDFAFIAFDVTFTVPNTTNTTVSFNKTLAYTFARGEEGCRITNGTGSNRTTCGFWTMKFFAGDNPTELMHHTQYHVEKTYSKLAIPLTSRQTSVISYACGKSTLNRFVNTVGNITDSFQHTGIQVQPFASLKATGTPLTLRFGSAYNCQGYLGTSSLMGVVSVLILLAILYLSSLFIFSIQTIDRFDDPRAETVKFEILH